MISRLDIASSFFYPVREETEGVMYERRKDGEQVRNGRAKKLLKRDPSDDMRLNMCV